MYEEGREASYLQAVWVKERCVVKLPLMALLSPFLWHPQNPSEVRGTGTHLKAVENAVLGLVLRMC